MLSVFMTPWMNPTSIHCVDERRLRVDHALEEGEVRVLRLRRVRVVAADRVVREPAHELRPPGHRRVLERADADVARGDAREHGTGQHRLAHDGLPRRDDGERPGGGDPERVHRLTDHVLAQHRADDRLAVAAACERRPPRALQVQVATTTVRIEDLAEQQRAAVAEARRRTSRTDGRRRPGRPATRRRGRRCRPGPPPRHPLGARRGSRPAPRPARR